jgi:hypothetical protein
MVVEPKRSPSVFWSYQRLVFLETLKWVWVAHLREWVVTTLTTGVGSLIAAVLIRKSGWVEDLSLGVLCGLIAGGFATAVYGIVGALRVSAQIHQGQSLDIDRLGGDLKAARDMLRLPESDPYFEAVRSKINEMLREVRDFAHYGTAGSDAIAYREAIPCVTSWDDQLDHMIDTGRGAANLRSIAEAHGKMGLPEREMWESVANRLESLLRTLRPTHLKPSFRDAQADPG